MTLALTVRQALAQSGLVPLDAQVLLAHAIDRDRAWIAAHATDMLAREATERFFALAKRRRDGEPVAYLIGEREFYGLAIRVTPDVLIPRPETEALVDVALRKLPVGQAARVLDLGTGSGAVALALAHERPAIEVVGTEISQAALDIASDNAVRLGLANVSFLRSDWYSGLETAGSSKFDLIVGNPPYVADADPHLEEGDVRFEPPGALSSGVDGLAALRRIVAGAPSWLLPGGALAVEHGYDQAERVRALFTAAGFVDIASVRDLAGIPRVASGRIQGPA